VVILPAPGRAQPAADLGCHAANARAQAAATRAIELRQQTEQVLAKAQIIADAWRERWSFPVRRDLLQQSEYARLLARLETMPVIERAKGIIMAQSRCGEAEAFDTLRRASQRSNLPVRDLAARIVAKAAAAATPATEPDRQSRTPTQARTKLLRAG
jgi:ANTAR domain